MQKNNILWWAMVIALLLVGFVTGWYCHSRSFFSHTRESGDPITLHDTIKSYSVQYKIIPGTQYNIDSLITTINQYWKDSLKNMYGKGLFESKFSKSDDLGSRTYTLASRIPLDPESQLTVDESFVFPKKTIALVGSLGYSASFGLKYYILDTKHFSFSGLLSGDYLLDKKFWIPNARLELEYKY